MVRKNLSNKRPTKAKSEVAKKARKPGAVVALPRAVGGGGMPFTLPYRRMTYDYEESVTTVSALGESGVFWSNLTFQNIVVSMYPNYLQIFEEFQIDRIRVYIGCASQCYSEKYSATIHSSVDLDETIPGSGDNVDLRANVKIQSIKEVIEKQLPIASFVPVIDLEGNALTTPTNKIWISTKAGKDSVMRGFTFYVRWTSDLKPTDPQNPPKITVRVESSVRFRGVI